MNPRRIVIVSLCALVIASVLVSSGIIYHQKCQVDPPLDVELVDIQMIPAGDIKIAYKEVGTGDPLLLIMGWDGTMDLWDPQMVNTLAAHYRVIIFDNRGMGGSTATEENFTIELFADDTANFMDALDLEHTHILGWSMGTQIALELALDHPEKVDKLILYSANCGGDEGIFPDPEVTDKFRNISGTPEERAQRAFEVLLPEQWLAEHPNPGAYFPNVTETSPQEHIDAQWYAMVNWNGSYRRLPQITQDTILITGTEDIVFPPRNSFKIAEQIPGAWLVQFRGGGHGLMFQYPERFSSIVLYFLKHSSTTCS